MAAAAGLLLLGPALGGLFAQGATASAPGFFVYLPIASRQESCLPLPEANYITLSAYPPGPHIPAELHPDLNLAVHGYVATDACRGLVDYVGPGDPLTPQFHDLFAVRRLPAFDGIYRVYSWDWPRMQRGAPIADPPVTAVGLRTTPGETLHVPDSGYTIDSLHNCEVLVLYASSERLTLKYTREDNVVYGYTLYVDGLCVDPALVALYEACNASGRSHLPALQPRQAFGRARSSETVVAIADCGTFLDPRARGWWHGY